MAALNYRPSDWFWFIGGDTNNVWSSARAMLVPATDADYVAWLDFGNRPANAATMSDVEATLAIAFPAGTPRSYSADQRYRKASGGVVISSLSAVPFLTDPVSRNTVNSAYDYALANAGVVVQWKLADGVTFIPLDKNKITSVMNTIAGFVQSCFTCESQMSAGITAGTITTLAQIDAAFAAISNVFP